MLIASDAPYEKFLSVKVDDVEVGSGNYTAESGSTKVTFKAEYLETLAEGEHTVEIVSTDGSASTAFTIEEAQQPVEYSITEGADSEWTQGSGEEVVLKTDAPADKITGLEIDGEEVDPAYYSVSEQDGETVITIDPEYLETLGEGDHDITVQVEDGYAETGLKVLAAEEPVNPIDTGDRSNLKLSFMLMLMSALGFFFVSRRKED